MRVGKLSSEELESIVFRRLPKAGGDLLAGPGIGLDCAVLKSKGDRLVLTADPITGTTSEIGRLAVHVACNDIAASGLRPTAVLLVLLAPPDATPEQVAGVVEQAAAAAEEIGVAIVGGHTEVSDAVTRFVLTAAAVGQGRPGQPILSAAGARPGDSLVMTKSAALEGTAILAADRSNRLSDCLSEDDLREAGALVRRIGVVPEGVLAGQNGVTALHDATEGGILGAAWEMAAASGCGLLVEEGAIPVHPLTSRICRRLGLDPLRLISSGSLLAAVPNPASYLAALADAGIPAAVIGAFREGPRLLRRADGTLEALSPPGPDELFRIPEDPEPACDPPSGM